MGDAEFYDRTRSEARDRFAVEQDFSRARRDQAGDRAQSRRFPGAVGAEQGDDGAFVDREGDAAQRFDLAVVDREVRDLEQRHHEAPR